MPGPNALADHFGLTIWPVRKIYFGSVSMKNFGAVIFTALCASGSFAAEPLADFEVIVRNCQAAFDAKPASTVAFMEKQQQWVKRVSAPAMVAYDVRKTESLVSPFTAYLEVTQMLSSKTAPDESTAAAQEVSFNERAILSIKRLNFAYRSKDAAWELVDGIETSRMKMSANEPFDKGMSAPMVKSRVLEDSGPIKQCASR